MNLKIIDKKIESFLAEADIRIVLPDDYKKARPWDIKLYDRSVINDTLLRGTLGFGDGYTNKKWDCDNLDEFFTRVIKLRQSSKTKYRSLRTAYQDIRSAFINTQVGKRAFHVGEQHYDLGNEMYQYMLGESMGYSCGLYTNKNDNLTKAQYNKFDLMCKSLKLKPGMKILEIGSGWGSFAKHAIENYKVEVVGLTVSKEQKKYAEERCVGLPAKFLLLDYQNLNQEHYEEYDRVVSIEMIEAVGKKNFKKYFSTIEKALKPNGLAGIQAIVGSGDSDPFLSTRIFPNGLVPSQRQIFNATESLLRLKNWYSFGTDYDRTLLDWDYNFRKNWSKIKNLKDLNGNKIYDEKFYRMWRFYLMMCAAIFRTGACDDAQMVFSKPNASSVLK